TTQVALIVSKLSRVKVIVQNFDLLPKDGKFLFISNHQSLQDPIAILGVFRKYKISYIMKDSLMKIPFVGSWLEAGGFLPIDRKNDRNALKTIIKAGKRLEAGYPIAVFPEGTRSGSKTIGEFKNGIFKIAQKAEAPVVVCLVENFYSIRKRFPLKCTKVLIRVCEVIPNHEFRDIHTNEIGNRCRNILLANQINARKNYSWIE
ncbi:MAG: 1-acyl-sn-glycerol-3-phosphate acyltransferase, partial [Bacilli bacterium]|nr:1-acyl-sn-glycerol-3-phosphate acyltransferase [Bacilli bacterium]